MSLVQIQTGLPTMKGITMDRTVFILKILTDILWYEFIWYIVKKNRMKLSTMKNIMKVLMIINAFALLLVTGIGNFVNLYFMTLWYFIIYPDRIIDELTEEQAKSNINQA